MSTLLTSVLVIEIGTRIAVKHQLADSLNQILNTSLTISRTLPQRLDGSFQSLPLFPSTDDVRTCSFYATEAP